MVSELSEAAQNRIRWWFYTVGTNIVAADTSKKNSGENPVTENWEEFQRHPQTEEEFESKLKAGKYDIGIAVVCGRLWRGEHKGNYLTCNDADNQVAVDELCIGQNGTPKISNLADKTLVEGHDDDLSRIKAFYIAPVPLNGKAINKDKNLNTNISKPSFEIKGISINGKFGLAFVSPSLHRDGKPYRPLGIQEIAVLDKEEKEKMELQLQDMCKKYGMEYLQNEDEVHNYIKYLEQPDTILEEGMRHNSLIEIASSYYFRWLGDWGKMTDEQRYAKLIEYDKAHCKPPLRDTDPDELDRIWEDTIKYGKDKRDKERNERGQDGRRHSDTGSSYNGYKGSYNKQTIYNQLPVAVRLGLDGNIWEVIRYNPIKFVVGHTEYKQIIFASMSSRRQSKKRSKTDGGGGHRPKNEFVLGIEEEEETIRMLEMEDIIINALPVEIIKHENPLVFSEQKYSIKFTSNITRNFTIAHKTLDEIVSELDHKSLIYMKKSAREALAVMVGAFSNDNKLVVNEDLDYPGFYYINGKLTENDVLGSLGIDYKTVPSKEDIFECTKFIEAFIQKYKRKEIVPTMLRFAVTAPFGFVLKQYTNDSAWIKAPFLVGKGRTGKTTLTDAVCALYYEWRSAKGKTTFASANTESRLGNIISTGTFPICINEMGLLDDIRYRNIVEMLKNCITTLEARGKNQSKNPSSYGKIPATRTLMFTANFPPPRDDAFQSRITKIVFTRMDRHTRKEVEEFNKFMDENAHKLRILGKFAISYIMNNPTCLLRGKKNECDPEVTAKEIITKFYESVDMQPPYWLDYVVSEAKDDSGYIAEGEDEFDDTSMHLRSVLIKYFNELYNRYVKNLAFMTDSNGKQITDQPSNPSLLDRIKFCIERNITTSISLGEDDTIVIFSTIMDELRENGIDTSLVASFAEVAGILDMEQGFKKLNKKTTRCISGTREKFLGFFEYKIEG